MSLYIFKRILFLNNTQIKALPTTGLEIVAAPGADLIVRVHAINIQYSFAGAIYSGFNATYCAFQIAYDGGFGEWPCCQVIDDSTTTTPMDGVTKMFGVVIHDGMYSHPIPYVDIKDGWWQPLPYTTGGYTRWVNKNLCVAFDNNGSGDLGGGHVNNHMRLIVEYSIESDIVNA